MKRLKRSSGGAKWLEQRQSILTLPLAKRMMKTCADESLIAVSLQHHPPLDESFTPAFFWNLQYEQWVKRCSAPVRFAFALERRPDDITVFETAILPLGSSRDSHTFRYVERLLKFLLWQQGAHRVHVNAPDRIVKALQDAYSSKGLRLFDSKFFAEDVYELPFEIVKSRPNDFPAPRTIESIAGGNWDGCRIGFDLGGSERKCVGLVDGRVIFSERLKWDPYFKTSPEYHYEAVQNSLNRAAAHLPRVDAIGGSAAGIYRENEVRVASLFRGVQREEFNRHIKPLFKRIQQEWGNIPFAIANDGEVAALHGSQMLGCGGVLGVSFGTSLAGGFVTPSGHITSWLNELAFAPVDYDYTAPRDEWSGDIGCGVQYFSQQAAVRLGNQAGIPFPFHLTSAEKNHYLYELLEKGNTPARRVYETIGTYLGYTIPHWHRFYQFNHLLLSGGVTYGMAGRIICEHANKVIADEFPELFQRISLHLPEEKTSGFGQAIAAASLPKIQHNL